MYIVYNSKIMIQTGGQTSINDNNVKIYSNEKIQITGKYTIEENKNFPNKYDQGIYAFENENTLTLFKLLDNKSFFSKNIITNEKVTFTKNKDAKLECTLYMGINNLGTKETTVETLFYREGEEYKSLDNDKFITYLLEKFNKHREFGEFIIAVYVSKLMNGNEGGQSRRNRQSRHNRQDAKPKRRTIKKEKRKK